MAAVRLTVGAASDGSMRTVFKPLVEAAREAAGQVKAIFKGMGSGSGDVFKDVPGAAAKATAVIEREAKRGADAEIREAKRAAQEKARAAEHVFQIKQRYLQQEEREAQRSMSKQAAEQQKHAERTGYWAIRYMDRTMKAAGSFASNMAKSAGVDLDLGAGMKRGFTLETKAVDVINQAKIAGQDAGPNGKARLMDLARRTGNENALDPNSAMSVLGSFQALSSDLAGGEMALGRLAELAKGTGTDFADMGKAAGAVNGQLMQQPEYQKDTVKRTEALLAIMRHVVKQTADGSVEMSDFARYMPRIASAASKYGGSYAENVGNLSAIAQMSMLGGASTASEATGSAAAWGRDITKKKTLQKWESAGLSPFVGGNDGPKEKLLSPQDMTVAYLKKFGANQATLAQYAPNDVSKRGMQNAMNIYSEAGGGDAGIKAVEARFKTFAGTMADAEVKLLASAKMETTESKAQVFQNQLDKIASSMADKLLPTLERLGPKLLSLTDEFSKLIAWVAENPGKALAAALVGSIARAQIETVIRAGIENLLKGQGGAKVGGVAGAINTVGSALTIAATAVTIASVGMMTIDKLMSMKEAAAEDVTNKEFAADNAVGAARLGIQEGSVTPEQVAELRRQKSEIEARIERTKEHSPGFVGNVLSGAVNYASGNSFGQSYSLSQATEADQAKIGDVYASLDKVNAALTAAVAAQERAAANKESAVVAALKAPLNVKVIGGMPGVDGKGRSKGP